MVSCFGTLTGLSGVASPQRLEILPYVLGGDTRAPGNAADPFYSSNDWSTKAGADIKYGLTSNLTLTAALNPDFGQVEADPSVINLTAFETFFPEKRPLFLEGEELFDFNIAFGLFLPNGGQQAQPFYSRRIGREPQGTAPDSAVFSDSPSSTTILGAAKLSGKTASGCPSDCSTPSRGARTPRTLTPRDRRSRVLWSPSPTTPSRAPSRIFAVARARSA